MRQVVRGQPELPEHDGQRGGDEQLAPAVAQEQERDDASGERHTHGGETHRVVHRAAAQQARVGYSPG